MQYRYHSYPDLRHLESKGNTSLRGVTFATIIPATGVSITDEMKESSEYMHYDLPIINLYTLPAAGSHVFPIQVEIRSFYDLDEIYYRIDSGNFQLYTSPLTINSECTIHCYGIRLDDLMTPMYKFHYRPSITIPVIYAIPEEGSYSGHQYITLSASQIDTIYYTLDGSTPTPESTLYTSPILVDVNTTIKAMATNIYGFSSPVYEFSYVIVMPEIITFEGISSSIDSDMVNILIEGNDSVYKYIVKETSDTPSVDDVDWSETPPTSFIFGN